MIIKEVNAKSILDSRKEKTILITLKTTVGNYSASAPNGKSKGKFEAKPYKKSLDGDINSLKDFSDYFSEENIDAFEDLRRIEDIVDGHIGANSLFALESCVLKALAKEKNKQVWKIINSNAKRFPRLVGNVIGGGKHSIIKKKPDFQEFLFIPKISSALQSFNINRNAKEIAQMLLKNVDEKFKNEENDENAWVSSMDDKRVLEVLKEVRRNIKDRQKVNLDLGVDVASSAFHKRKIYYYENPMLKRSKEEQVGYLVNLIKNYNLFYIEDPFEEEDFEGFSKLLKKFPDRLIVGDDLIATNSKKLEKAIEKNSVNAIIIKPNQCGSLLEVKRVCELAKKNNIKLVFSHRSGETDESILADLAFGFGADFFKCGIDGREREAKLRRLIEIEKSLKLS